MPRPSRHRASKGFELVLEALGQRRVRETRLKTRTCKSSLAVYGSDDSALERVGFFLHSACRPHSVPDNLLSLKKFLAFF